ncbi:MAG: formylglycine-generating enzyme family protein [Acidobacteriota bacterium]
MMGSPTTEEGHEEDEAPVHGVTIAYDFYLGKYEVTQAQWLAMMGNWPDAGVKPNPKDGMGGDYPAYGVSWNDYQVFIRALNKHLAVTRQGPAIFRLPSEAEWEYACRAGTQTRFSFGDSVEQAPHYLWFRANNDPAGTKPVGQKQPNPWGLFDMHGNVWEWCQDWYHSSYEGAPTNGSAWESPVTAFRILHGGDFDNKATACRSANRNDHRCPDDRSPDLGFRVVLTRTGL